MSSAPKKIEPIYVVDTHALIWYLLGNKKLGDRAKMIFEEAKQGETSLVLPAIVLAELYFANVKYGWFENFQTIYQDLMKQPYFRFVPFDPGHVLDFKQDAAVPEMHDRIITGVARRLDAPVITSDALIIASDVVRTEW